MGPVALAAACCVGAAVCRCKPALLGHGQLAHQARTLGGRACVAEAAWAVLNPWLVWCVWRVWPAPLAWAHWGCVLVLCLWRFHRLHEQLLRLFVLEILVYTQILKMFWRVSRRACLLVSAVAAAGVVAGKTGARVACFCTALLVLKLCCSAWRTDLMTEAALMQVMRTRAALVYRPACFHSFVAYLSWTTQRFFRTNVSVPVPEEQRQIIAAELSVCLTLKLCVGPVLALRAFGAFMLCCVLPVLWRACCVLVGLAWGAVIAALTVAWRAPGALEDLLQVHRQYCDYGGWVLCGA